MGVPSTYSISDIAIQDEYVWCVTSLCEIFLFSANMLHPKIKPVKVDLKTIRTKNVGLPSSRGAKAKNPDLGRKKQKGITLRKKEEVARKLANPMLTLRKLGSAAHNTGAPTVPAPQPPQDIRVLASNGQVLPCKLQADSTTKVSTLLQKLIPLGLKQMNITQPGLPYEIMWYSNNQPTRFSSSELSQPVLKFGTNFILNRIPTQNMESILVAHKIGVYCVLNATPEPSAQIQIVPL